MSEALSYAERALAWVVRQHFRIPPAVFWAMVVGGAVLAPFLPLVAGLVSIAISAVGVMGVLRWRWHRRRLALIVLPQPVTVDPTDRLAVRAQELIIESLAPRLTADEAALVHPIPARLGPTDVRLADAIRRRLGSPMIVLGRIDRRSNGGWSLFSGVLSPPEEEVTHVDWHTRDRLPARAEWEVWLDRFTPTRDVQDVQEPLLMSGEIEAVVRSFAGYIASWSDDLERAEREFRAAISASGDSDSAVIDLLRCELAKVLMRMDRRDEARSLLRSRVGRGGASAELLRTFARVLGRQPGDYIAEYVEGPEELRSEALEALRAAAEIRGDPKRAMTLYNLSALLSDEGDEGEESHEALIEAMRTSRYYRQAWYTRRTRAAMHWYAGRAASARGDAATAKHEFKQAARWYSAALRSRPRFRLFWREGMVVSLIRPFPPSPVLHANAEDAHGAAGHRVRTAWHHFRTERARRSRVKRGDRLMAQQKWEGAYANYDFAVIGRSDVREAVAAVLRAVALQQLGETEAAAADFAKTDARFPALALPIRWRILEDPPGGELPRGVPGVGPTDLEGVRAELRRRGFDPPPALSR